MATRAARTSMKAEHSGRAGRGRQADVALITALESKSQDLVDEAVDLLGHRLHPPYRAVDPEVLRRRLGQTMDTLITALRERTPLPVLDYARRVARSCFNAGFHLEDIQTHFNALEETIWRYLVNHEATEHLHEDLARVASIIGAIKDELGRTYVNLAAHHRAPAINTRSLYAGTQSVPEHPMSGSAQH